MNSEDLTQVVEKLDTLVRLVAVGVCGEGTQKEKIKVLSTAGLEPKEIASILGTTPNTVSVALSSLRRDAKKKAAKSKVPGGSR